MLKGCLPFAALAVMTACVDDKYDLSDIDTTSRINVNDLTVPINLEKITLDDVVDLDDNENITKITVNGHEVYALQQGGDINTSDFQINGIHVNAPVIPSTSVSVPVGGLPTDLGVTIPEMTIPVSLPTIPEQEYTLKMENVDAALVSLENIKTKAPISVSIILQVPSSIMSGNQVAFKNLVVTMPWGLMCDTEKLSASCPGTTYNASTGCLNIPELAVDASGKASLSFEATGLELNEKGALTDHKLDISGKVGIQSGEIELKVTNVNIPNPFTLDIDYTVSSFDIASFSGDIDYKMDDINIEPITLNDLPDFLDSPETEIRIANPYITISVNNPVGSYGLEGYGQIKLTSNFSGGNTTTAESDLFNISQNGANLSFGSRNDGYDYVAFPGLGDILANSAAGGLPESITVNIENLQFAGHAVDFPIGTIGKAQGDYDFTAPLGFASPSKIVYETTEDGWGSDDLDDINIEYINLTADCNTNIPVAVQLSVYPVDKYGNTIAVTEDNGNFIVPAFCSGESVSLRVQGASGPIRNFDGIKFRAVISQDDADNTEAIGPDLYIELLNVRITVDGYYETKF